MNNDCLRGIVGYLIAAGVGHVVVGWVVRSLWAIAEKDLETKGIKSTYPLRPHPTVSLWHGIAERSVYFASVLLKKPEGIAVWLGFKAVMRWKVQENDERHVPGSPIYMIGTALNVMFGILGAFIAAWNWKF